MIKEDLLDAWWKEFFFFFLSWECYRATMDDFFGFYPETITGVI
jgi:hypothetical protein